MSTITAEFLEKLDVDEVMGECPEDYARFEGFVVATLLVTARDNMHLHLSHDRWVLMHVIYTYGEPEEPVETWVELRQLLCDCRDYFRWRRVYPKAPVPAEPFIPAGRGGALKADVLGVCEAVFRFHEQRGSVDRLIDSLPLETDPADFDGVHAACSSWYAANKERCDNWHAMGQDLPAVAAQWVTLADLIKLQVKLEADPMAKLLLDRLNIGLKARKVGTLTLEGVAAIGVLFRKNIEKKNGQVPVIAIERFFARSNTLGKQRRLHHLQIGVARDILIGCGFMEMVREANRSDNLCAVYRLLDEQRWN